MKFRVNREKWVRGGAPAFERFGSAKLLNDRGNMCCLGFVSKQCGAKTGVLLGKSFPSELGCTLPAKAKFLLEVDEYQPWLEDRAQAINDDPALKPNTREAKLKALFREAGHEIEFYGRTPRRKK